MAARSIAALLALLLALSGACGDDAAPAQDAGEDGGPRETRAEPPAATRCSADLQCDDGVYCNGEERCEPDDPNADRVGCLPASAGPCSVMQRCDEVGERCMTLCELAQDADGDGVVALECGGDDCADHDADRYPGNAERCDPDHHDEDCDPHTHGGLDADGDEVESARCCNLERGGAMSCGPDCDDFRRDVQPTATEDCDGRDNDCDGSIDERVARAGFFDGDFDEHGDPSQPMFACAGSSQLASEGDDCDDGQPARHAALGELCDELDNDCDGVVDEDPTPATWYLDADGDDFGASDGDTLESCEPVAGYSLRRRDCDDGAGDVNPAAAELCDGGDNDCDGAIDEGVLADGYADDDGDGYGDAQRPRSACSGSAGFSLRAGDCDDHARNRHDDRAEECDQLDNDCDGEVDEGVTRAGFVDADRDLHGDPAHAVTRCGDAPGFALLDDDCDDADPSVNAGQAELCDGLDNDCDGTADEDASAVTWYRDADGDGSGAADQPSVASCAPLSGYALLPLDCDDTQRGVNPAAPELCNGRDDDCNGRADYLLASGDFEDDDGDRAPDRGCEAPGSDCDDRDPSAYPGAPELCDGADDDCDGRSDENQQMVDFRGDADGDGYGDDFAQPIPSCLPLPGYVARGGDCDDSAPELHPGVGDGCDGIDGDCDGRIDEDALQLAVYGDADGDGYAGGPAQLACALAQGMSAVPADCDDGDPSRRPGAVERCNGLDEDCDGRLDEGVTVTAYRDRDADLHGAGPAVQACIDSAGFVPSADDCNDQSPAIHPGQLEFCDGVDNDCDSQVDEEAAPVSWYLDADGDGYGSPALAAVLSCAPLPGYSLLASDCNDHSGESSPVADERCDGVDNDCDQRSDEGLRGLAPELCEGRRDEDCDGAVDEGCGCVEGTGRSCGGEQRGECEPGLQVCSGGAFSACAGRVLPRRELCDQLDNDCDGKTDEDLGCAP